jgi:hypothetical protein
MIKSEPTAQQADRRAVMPFASSIWDAIVEQFGMPASFTAHENGQKIEYKNKIESK